MVPAGWLRIVGVILIGTHYDDLVWVDLRLYSKD